MEEELLISVIVPSYNQGSYIKNTILSVLNQSYPHWEMLIQDSCSPDQTAEVCNRYARLDSRIHFQSEKDEGFADAVNRALRIAKGSIAIILNSDDFLSHSGVFEEATAYWKKIPGLNILSGDSKLVDTHLNEIMLNLQNLFTSSFISPKKIFYMEASFRQSSTFFSVNRAKEIGMLNIKSDMVADTDLWIRMSNYKPSLENKVYFLTELWSYVTVHEDQRSSDPSKFWLGRAGMFVDFVHDDRMEIGYEEKRKAAIVYILDAWEYCFWKGLPTEQAESLYKKLTGKSIPLRKKIKKNLGMIKSLKRKGDSSFSNYGTLSYLTLPRGSSCRWF